MKIALATMVRNAKAILPRLLSSVERVAGYYVFSDTGSTDGTPDLIRDWLRGHDGEMHHDPWSDFGTNRSLLVSHARGRFDYLLTLDADHELVLYEGAFPELCADVYTVDVRGGSPVRILLHGDRPWWYQGRTHEQLALPPGHGDVEIAHLPGAEVVDHSDAATRSYRHERDLALLLSDLRDDPRDTRAAFYLGMTLERLALVEHRRLGRRVPRCGGRRVPDRRRCRSR